MMPRYVVIPTSAASKPRCWADEAPPPLQHPQVYERDPIATGVLTKDGHPIYRVPERIGFLRQTGDR